MDLAELLEDVRARGYDSNFSVRKGQLHCPDTGEVRDADDARIVDSRSVDQGTDPGDDATIYLIELRDGRRGYLLVSDSFHADPANARFIDRLLQEQH